MKAEILFLLLVVVVCAIKANPFLPTSQALGDPPNFAALFPMGPQSAKKDKKDKDDDDDDDEDDDDEESSRGKNKDNKKGRKNKGKSKKDKNKDSGKDEENTPFSHLGKMLGLSS